jgi:hypothetical protein
MGMVGSRRAAGALLGIVSRVRVGLLASAALALSAAGCSTALQGPVAAAPANGATVAFVSIDGPPQSIFNKLVQDLNEEATAHQVAVVSRNGPAQYRVRGYLAAVVESRRRTTAIAWVWDVYDADQQRAVRLSGEERASSAGQGTWAAADDGVLRRIARSGMDQLAAFLAAPGAQPTAPPGPSERGPNVVAIGDPASRRNGTSSLAYAGGAPSRTEADGEKFRDNENPRIATRIGSLLSRRRPAAAQLAARKEAGNGGQERSDQARRRQLESAPRRGDRRPPQEPARQGGRAALRRHGDLRRDPRERARV